MLKMVEGGAEPERPPLRADYIATGLLALILIIAPLWAAGFATPDLEPMRLAQGGIIGLLNAIGVPLLLLLTGLTAVCVLFRETIAPTKVGSIPGVWAGAAGLGIWATASLFIAPVKYLSINGLSVLLSALLIGGMMARLSRERRLLFVLLGAVILAGSVIGGIGVREYLFKWKVGDAQMRSFATFTNPNFLAGYLLLTIPLTLGAFAAARDRTAKLAIGIGLALQTSCLMLTASRAGAAMMLASVIVWLVLVLLSREHRGRMAAIGQGVAIVITAAILASAPTLSRVTGTTTTTTGKVETAAVAQAHSAEFRKYTWIGTFRAAAANPLLGTGIGSFEAAYPRYAQTAFTQHAHNSYLQLASETGWVGAVLLMAALAAVVGFALRALIFPTQETETQSPEVPFHPLFAAPKLILAGLLASLFGSMVHSVFDSDWYVVATVITLCAVLALLASFARAIIPEAANVPQKLARPYLIVGAVIALLLSVRGVTSAMERVQLVGAGQDIAIAYAEPSHAADALNSAATAYRSASGFDPYDPEPWLGLATVGGTIQKPEDVERELKHGAQIAPVGKTFYRLGRALLKNGEAQEALKAFSEARKREPRNLQNLRWLADTQEKIGQTEDARLTYESMTDLEKSVYGRVRAVPEMVETDFAYAHLGLARIALAQNQTQIAREEYAKALDILRQDWQGRNRQENAKTPDKRKELLAVYLGALDTERELIEKHGAIGDMTAAQLAEEKKTVEGEQQQEEAKANAPQETPNP